MGEYNKLFLSCIFLILFNYSLQQILIPFNPFHSRSNDDGPTVVSKETFTVTSNDGTPITVTRIGIRRGKNINNGQRQTPLDLMRLMDDRISSIFEEIIRERIGLNLIMQRPEEAKKENKDENNNNKEEKENKDEKDDKEFELDENKDDDKNKNKKGNKTQENIDNSKNKQGNTTEANKEEGKVQENKTSQDNNNKADKNVNNNNKETETKKTNKKKGFGKLKINPEALKPKRRAKKKLSRKEVIFSRVCKYIFYSIILFTIYGLVRKLLELLEIIDPETNLGLKNVKVDNEEEIKKKNNDIVLNKQKENKQY